MIARLIRWAIVNRFLVLLATVMVAAWGVYSLLRTPLDALPDLSDVQVIIRVARSTRKRLTMDQRISPAIMACSPTPEPRRPWVRVAAASGMSAAAARRGSS